MRAGHTWIFSNEVDVATTPLTDLEPGAPANVVDHTGKALGTAYVNPGSLICARLVSRRANTPLDLAMLRRRVAAALALRERFGFERCYRLIYGESDGLPGLSVDRHDDLLVVQIGTAGMECLRDAVIDTLVEVVQPARILLRNDSQGRVLEGLPEGVEWVHGEAQESYRITENGVQFVIDPVAGQKTGWFYDHRDSRSRLARYAPGARVLDLFSYAGGFALQAAAAGAREVVCVDTSADALALLAESAQANVVADRVHCERGDVFDVLKTFKAAGERFDVVVVDPPAFARRKRDLKAAIEAYRRVNRLALGMLGADGILLSASCSSHVDRRSFEDGLKRAARAAGRPILELERLAQGPDHPVHPAISETDYLKGAICVAR